MKAKPQPTTPSPSARAGRNRRRSCLSALILLALGVFLAATAAWLLVERWQSSVARSALLAESDPRLNPVERFTLQRYLLDNEARLQQAAGAGETPMRVEIIAGATAVAISNLLAQNGLLDDSELFLNYLRYKGMETRLKAGVFTLDPRWTVVELAEALTTGAAQEITLSFLPGWRSEEMANYLAVTTPANIDAAEFLAIVRRERPFNVSAYDFLASLPPEATLEGFLFPGAYAVPRSADAAALVAQMLGRFGEQVTPTMRQAFGARGLALRDAVTLASIVEREAPVEAERPLIAAVFVNRLAIGMPLQADPTVQYAAGYQAGAQTWWKSALTLEDLARDHPYNTYVIPGLPPGPIANPSLSALQAVANPADTPHFFFVAGCGDDAPGEHIFSVTYEEHLANVARCR